MPPVCNCIVRTPYWLIVCASTSLSISASITPISTSSLIVSIVRDNVVVFPEPGLDMILSKKTPFSLHSCLNKSASLLLSSNILCFTSITLYICKPLSLDILIDFLNRVNRTKQSFNKPSYL